jgi:putative adhesin
MNGKSASRVLTKTFQKRHTVQGEYFIAAIRESDRGRRNNMRSYVRWLTVALAAGIIPLVAPSRAASQSFRRAFERIYKVSGPVQLHIRTESSDVVVRPSQTGQVRVKGIIHISGSILGDATAAEQKAREIGANPPIQQDGNLIRIGLMKDAKSDEDLQAFPKYVSIDYEVETPADTQVNSKTGSGDYSISGLQGPVTIETGSGDVKIDSVKGKVRITTGSGDVNLEGSGAEGIQVETGSGDVSLHLPSQAGYELKAHTGSGDIDLGPSLAQSVSVTENEAHGKINGGTHPLDVQTGSGDISIK